MKLTALRNFGLTVTFLLLSVGADAALISYQANGVELVYDEVQDLTWMRDANLFKTQYDTDNTVVADIIAAVPTITSSNGTHTVVAGDFNTTLGRMTWYGAMAWVEWLRRIDYAGADDWRLPAIIDTGAPGCDYAYVGTDCGFNADTATGELASLFYDTLGNLAYYDTNADRQSGWGLLNTGPFGTSMKSALYWSGREFREPDAWLFNPDSGSQGILDKVMKSHAWAVHPGQIPAVPSPGSALLLTLGLGVIFMLRRPVVSTVNQVASPQTQGNHSSWNGGLND